MQIHLKTIVLTVLLFFSIQGNTAIPFYSLGEEDDYIVLNEKIGILEQITQANTIYIIRHDFDINDSQGKTPVNIPIGCTLRFEGGSLSNGTLKGNNTIIEAGIHEIFKDNIKIEGSWSIAEAYPEWFGARGDGKYDDAIAINQCLSFSSKDESKPIKILFTKPSYFVDKTIWFSGKSRVCFEGFAKNCIKKTKGSLHNMFDGAGCKSIKISGLTLDGSLDDWNIEIPNIPNWSNKTFNACIIGASNTTDFILDNCVIKNFYYGVYLGGANNYNRAFDKQHNTDHITITNCIFESNKKSCIDTYNRYGLFISNNLFQDNGNIAIHIEPTIYEDLSGPYDTSDILTSKYPSDGVNICNNTFMWNNTPCVGIKLYRGVYAANVTNNHFTNGSSAIISDGTKMFNISNNTIKNGAGINVFGKIGSGSIYGNVLLNVNRGISCYSDEAIMGGIDVHDNIIIYKEGLTTTPDNFRVQNSKFHDNIIRGFFDNSDWRRKGVLDISGASNCEIYNNKLLKCREATIPGFIVPITNQEDLSLYIKKGVRIYNNVYEQKLDYEFSTDVAKTRPNNPYIGQQFYDLNLNKLIIFVGKNWVDFSGKKVD